MLVTLSGESLFQKCVDTSSDVVQLERNVSTQVDGSETLLTLAELAEWGWCG